MVLLRDEQEDEQPPLNNIAPESEISFRESLGARPKTMAQRAPFVGMSDISPEDTQRFEALMTAFDAEKRRLQGLLEPRVNLARMLDKQPGSVGDQRLRIGHGGRVTEPTPLVVEAARRPVDSSPRNTSVAKRCLPIVHSGTVSF